MACFVPRRCSTIVRCLVACAAVVSLGPSARSSAREQLDVTGRFAVRWWTVADGLPETPLTGLAHAPDGSLVCGSRSRLVRFDGVAFRPFPKPLTDQLHAAIGDFWSLGFDGQGRLWVQGGQAVARLDAPSGSSGRSKPDEHWTVYWLPAQQITGMSFGNDGRPICVSPDAVWLFNGTGFAGLSSESVVGADEVRPAWRYGRTDPRSGSLWLWSGGGDATVWRLSPPRSDGHGPPLEATSGPAPFAVVSVGTGPGGACALLADGAAVHRDGQWRRVPLPLLDDEKITSGKVAEAADGTLWISTHDALLACTEGRVETTIDALTGFSMFTHCLSPDRRGGVWATCSGGLLAIHRKPDRFDHVPRLTAVYERADGSLLVGSPGEVRRRFPNSDTAITADEPVATLPRHAVPTAILETPEGRIWVGTQDAFLWRIDDGRATQVTKPTGEPSRELRSITSLVRDGAGRIWVGSSSGLAVSVDDEAFALVPSHGGNVPLRIVGLAVDRDGSLLVAANGRGVERLLPGGQVQPILPRRLTPGRQAIVFHRDAREGLWVGGESGLVRVSVDGEILQLSTATGLVSDAIRQIEEDAAGRLWVATRDGRLQGMRLDDIDALARSAVRMVRGVVVDLAHGLGAAECLGRLTRDHAPGATATAARATFVVPLDQGVTRFEPASLPPSDRPSQPPIVTPVVGRHDDGDVCCVWHSPGMHLDGPPLHQTLLHGVEDGWSAADATSRRDIRGLPPGRYTLAVRRVDGETDASFPQATAHVTVPLPWWRRPWTIATAAAGIVAAGIVAVRALVVARTHRAIADLERQRAREQERARIARDIHDSLGAGLTRMALMSENARRAAGSSADLHRRLDALYRDAHGLARTVDEIVWAVNPLHDTLAGFLSFTMQEVEESARAGGLELDFDVPADPPDAALDASTRHHASLAVREAVQNVLRHAGATRITYRVRVCDGMLEVTVADDGRGFDPAATVSDSQDGLRNIRCRIAELGGSVEIVAAPGRGVAAIMHVPLTPPGTQTVAGAGRRSPGSSSVLERQHARS